MSELPLPLAGPDAPVTWPDADEIRAVFLDAGNTLLLLDFDLIAATVREAGFPIEALTLERAEYEARRLVDRAYLEGDFDDRSMWRQYFTWILDASGVAAEVIPPVLTALRERHAEENLWRRPSAGAASALARIRASGRKLGVISNSDGTCRDALRRAGLLDHLDVVIDSSEVGIEKPHAGIFEVAVGELGVAPSAALHMGDLEAIDVRGARRAGLLPVLVDPYPPQHEVDYRVLRRVADLPLALGL